MSLPCECCVFSEFCATDRSLFQRSPNKCVLSEYDCDASITRRSWHTRVAAPPGGSMAGILENILNQDVQCMKIDYRESDFCG
jgi:hypothetical protein